MPLVVTVTVATVGLAAWVWSQRNDEDEEDTEPIQQGLDYENADYGDNPAYGATGGDDPASRPPPSFTTDPRPGESGYGTTNPAVAGAEPGLGPGPAPGPGTGWGATMSGALRRTSSPQQFISSTSRTVAAGMAAAGAAVGSALASIREPETNAYADHETWSEEADAKKERPAGSSPKEPGKKRKSVAIVVSADTPVDDADEDGFHEHAVSLDPGPSTFVLVQN